MANDLKMMSKPFIKTILLIIAMIIISILISQILSTIRPRIEVTESMRLRREASSILDTLVSSEDCLAVEWKIGEKIIDLKSLEDFQSRYPDIEPECARSYDYGYYVEVESGTEGKKFYFGSRNHSGYYALKASISLSIPIKIMISETELQSSKITIKMYKGELEELVGLIDRTCETGSEVEKTISLSYPVELKDSYLCMKAENEFCRKFGCDLDVEFDGISSLGTYTFFFRRENNIVKVNAG